MRPDDAAAGGRGVANGFRRQHGALEGVRRRYVRLRRAFAHADADAGGGEIDAAGHDLAFADQRVDRLAAGEKNIGGLTGFEMLEQRAGRRIEPASGVAAGALERRKELVGDGLERGRDEGIDPGGVGGPHCGDQCHYDWGDERAHDCQWLERVRIIGATPAGLKRDFLVKTFAPRLRPATPSLILPLSGGGKCERLRYATRKNSAYAVYSSSP